jgi:hypothetical protein
MGGEEPSTEPPFSRMLEPGDPWVEHPGDAAEQALNFRGQYDGISVCDTTICEAVTGLAAFYGARRAMGPLQPMYLLFTPTEVDQAGGELRSTDANPPKYNEAHHDVVEGQDAVAEHIARLFQADQSRRVLVTREEMLDAIFELLARGDVHDRFRKSASWRARKLFNGERELWNRLADRNPILESDPAVQKELRKEEQARRAKK